MSDGTQLLAFRVRAFFISELRLSLSVCLSALFVDRQTVVPPAAAAAFCRPGRRFQQPSFAVLAAHSVG